MDDWVHIISYQWNITLLTNCIKWVCCELNRLSREQITRSHVNLNKASSRGKMSLTHRKFHWWYYVNFLISKYLSYNQQSTLANQYNTLAIDGTKTSSMGFIDFSNPFISNISDHYNLNKNLILSSQTKCGIIFSDLESDHIFSIFFSVTYLFFFRVRPIQTVIQNTINSWNYMSFCEINVLSREHIMCSHMNLNKVGLRGRIS